MSEQLQIVATRCEGSPFNATLGVRVESVEADRVRLRVPFKDENSNPGRALHGGVAASTIGIESRVIPLAGQGARRFHLPDGSDRFLVDEAMLRAYTARLRASFLEPIKTVNVENQRCMTTWVLKKN